MFKDSERPNMGLNFLSSKLSQSNLFAIYLPDIAGTSQINKKTNKIKFLITLQENLCQTLAPYIAMRLRFIYYRFLFSLSLGISFSIYLEKYRGPCCNDCEAVLENEISPKNF